MTAPQQGTRTSRPDPRETQEQTQGKGNNTPGEVPKYTETQWSEMRRKLQLNINGLEADNVALKDRVEELEGTNLDLTEKAKTLQAEIDDGIPTDAKEYLQKLRNREESQRKREAQFKKDTEPLVQRMAQENMAKKESLAKDLADKFGVDVDTLLSIDDPVKMKAYAVDNYTPGAANVGAPGNSSSTKLPSPTIPVSSPQDGTGSLSPMDKIRAGLQK